MGGIPLGRIFVNKVTWIIVLVQKPLKTLHNCLLLPTDRIGAELKGNVGNLHLNGGIAKVTMASAYDFPNDSYKTGDKHEE